MSSIITSLDELASSAENAAYTEPCLASRRLELRRLLQLLTPSRTVRAITRASSRARVVDVTGRITARARTHFAATSVRNRAREC